LIQWINESILFAGRLPGLHHIVERQDENSTGRVRKIFFFRAITPNVKVEQ